MRSSNSSAATGKLEVPYTRKREHPQFDGIKRTNSAMSVRLSKRNSPGDGSNSTLSRSLSDIWEFESKFTPDIADNTSQKSEKTSTVDEEIKSIDDKPMDDRQKNIDSTDIYLPQSAASFFGGNLLKNDVSVFELCQSMYNLNQYLKASKVEIKAGVPGRYLKAVISQDATGVGCFVCTIMYAFFLNETQSNSQICTVPVLNMKREDLRTHSELKWLVRSCRIDESSLVFIDEAELSYYNQFGNLKIVLVNGNHLPAKREGLREAVVEIFFCKEVDSEYPLVEKITLAEDGSCCTLIAEYFLEATPEILAGGGFCRLLLSGILLDTANLTSDNCTNKDKYISTLLIKGAGRFGCSGLYQILKHKIHDTSDLTVRDILRREFKKWTRVAGKPNSSSARLSISHVGMSFIKISIEELLTHKDFAAEEIIIFQESEKLRLFMIVSGYYDNQNNFKREILISTSTAELMTNFLRFLDTKGTHLPLKDFKQFESREELRAFEIDNKLTARRSIERLLEEFGKSSRNF